MNYIFKLIWWLIGWKIVGDVPRSEKKYIIITAPHTSNWDFMIGVLVRSVMGFDSKFLGKKSLFRFPFGWFFKRMGGYPVDRSKSTNLVDKVVDIFNRHEKFVVAIAPEGTRKNVKEWKTGFYYIAHRAKIPIVRAKIDRRAKEVRFFDPVFTSGDIVRDMPKIKEVYN
ncbi:MAG: lysophospholipid acyltransferase family protein [Cytophagales bacterium]|nr:lysophospholipid acyltransferase family protein [Cytophagales bacterium]